MVSANNIRVVRVGFKAIKPPWRQLTTGMSLAEMLAAGCARSLILDRIERGVLEFDQQSAVRTAIAAWTAAHPKTDRKKRGPKPKRPNRPCLRCRTPFPSLGIHNRLCLDCHHFAAQATGYNL